MLKCTKFDFRWGYAQTSLWELTALPQTSQLYWKRPTSKRGEGKIGKMREEERGKKAKGGGKVEFLHLLNKCYFDHRQWGHHPKTFFCLRYNVT